MNLENLKVVLVGGTFDLLHKDHVKLLRKCKRLGDILIVCVLSDRNVKSRKGPDRPILKQRIRARLVASLEFVDFVFISTIATYHERNLRSIKPDILVLTKEKGKIRKRKKLKKEIEAKFADIEVRLLKRIDKTSTTKVIRSMLDKKS